VKKFRDEMKADTKPQIEDKIVNPESLLAAASLR
jgi:hypothetical protein